MLHLVWPQERNDKTLTPTPTGIFLLTASDWEFCATNRGSCNVIATDTSVDEI